jgi:hypothetical protein
LGGWLILVGFGLCAALIWRPLFVIQNWEGYFSTTSWQAVAIPGGERYHPMYAPALIFEVLGNIWLFGLNVLALCLYFAKRRIFPKVFITLLLATVAFVVLDEVLCYSLPGLTETKHGNSGRVLARSLIQTAIWCSYMLASKRVKATFVR